MKNSILFLLLSFSYLFALTQQEIAGTSYQIRVGEGNDLKVRSVEKKEEVLPPIVQTKDGKPVAGIDYSNAIILDKILTATKVDNNAKLSSKAVNYLVLPKTYTADMKDYQSRLNNSAVAKQKKINNKQEILVIAKCKTYQDYKINDISSLKMMCSTKDNSHFILYSKVNITYDKKPELKAVPYMLETINGNIYTIVQNKSFLYNATNGSVNLATYVNKRALEKIAKSMSSTVGNEVPKMADDYINKKYATSSTVSQTDTSTVTATTTPTPEIADYGFSLLAKVISSGIKAASENLYQNLGYIYYIPKGSIVDAEIVYSVSTGNKK